MDISLSARMKGTFRAIGRRLGGISEGAATAADLGIERWESPSRAQRARSSRSLASTRPWLKLKPRVGAQLAAQKRRFLVVIDDIDRLSPDDALSLFRLVKSVGRLPNVIYLLALDRPLIEKATIERYPSEGAHYLEKIVQVWFDLPLPTLMDLRKVFVARAQDIMGKIDTPERSRQFMNAFYGTVARHLKTPRDVVRLINALRITYPPVRGEVHTADFLILETVRLFYPALHAVIAGNRELLCGIEHSRSEQASKRYEELLMGVVPEAARQHVREALMSVFPRLETIWDKRGYGDGFEEHWRRDRRACSRAHFNSYFRFTLSGETYSARELDAILAATGNVAAVAGALRSAVSAKLNAGGTRAAILLDELNVNAKRIPRIAIPNFLRAVFSVADELRNDADEASPHEWTDNRLRLHWLVDNLTSKLDMQSRSFLIMEAAKFSTLHWLVDLAVRCKEQKGPDEDRLVDDATRVALSSLAQDRLQDAALDGTLAGHDRVVSILDGWRRLDETRLANMQNFVKENLFHSAFVARLAKACVGMTSTHSDGDFVAVNRRSIRLETVEPFLLPDELERRVQEVLADPVGLPDYLLQALAEFQSLPRRRSGSFPDDEDC